MKYILLTICALVFASYSTAQDLIIIQNKDSINCKVLKIDSTETSIKIKRNNIISIEKFENDKIISINYNFYKKKLKKTEHVQYLSHFANFNLGYYKNTYLDYKPRNINITRSAILNSINNEKSYVFGMNIWSSDKSGIGISYDHMSDKYEYLYEYGTDRFVYKEAVKIDLVSFNYLRRWLLNKTFRNQIIFSPSIDFIMFKASTTELKSLFPIVLQPIEYYKNNFGLGFGIAYERNLTKHINIGVKTQYRFSQMYTVYRKENGLSDIKDLKNNDKIILSKIQIGVYLNLF